MRLENGQLAESADHPSEVATLAELPPLAVATVLDVLADDDDSARLKAMGICIGRRVQLVQQGDPLVVRAIGIRIGLSRRLAERVLMQPIELPAPEGEDKTAE